MPLSVIVSLALTEPAAVGENATHAVHDPEAARVTPQLLSCRKDLAPVPVSEIEVSSSVVLPELVIVTVFGIEMAPLVTVPKDQLMGLNVTVGRLAPVPLKVTFCGEPLALSVIDSVAE